MLFDQCYVVWHLECHVMLYGRILSVSLVPLLTEPFA